MTDNATQQEPPRDGPEPGQRADFGEFIKSMDARAWRAVTMSVVSVVLVLLLLVVGRFFFGDEIERFIDSTLGQANRGHWGLLATILVFTLTAYVGAPQVALIAACVVAFGAETGFWYSWIATVVSGVATYFTGRLTSGQTQKRFGGATGVVPGDEDVHIAPAGNGGGDGVEGGALEAGVVVFGDDECGHVSSTLLIRSLWLRCAAFPPGWPRRAP